MASQWHSQVSQKLFLARVLLGEPGSSSADDAQTPNSGADAAMRREAARQGGIELLLRARGLLSVMVARFYQQRVDQPMSLDELAALLGEDCHEVTHLRQLSQQADSWWNHLDQLELAQSRPPTTRKTVSTENIIAISADTGPDRSTGALLQTLDTMKMFADNLEEQHSEW